MIRRPFNIGVCIGLVLLVVFLVIHFIQKTTPQLTDAIRLVVACLASVSSVDCVRIVLKKSADLGELESHKLTVLLGALAVFWVAVQIIFNIFRGILTP
jgi:hypothetical protein